MKDSITQNISQARIKALVKWGLIAALTCSGIYLGTNEIAAQRTSFYQLYFEFERDIPMVPWMIHVYNSFHVLLLLNFLIIKNPLKIRAIAISLIASSAIASVFFLLFPAELGFSRTENMVKVMSFGTMRFIGLTILTTLSHRCTLLFLHSAHTLFQQKLVQCF